MNILHLNDKVEISGGVEIHINQLCELGSKFGLNKYWLGVYSNNKNFFLKEHLNNKIIVEGSKLVVLKYIENFCNKQDIDIIHIHSLSIPTLLNELFSLRPIVRSMHEPRMVCPGQGKFWRNSETICEKPFGLHCIYHIYKEGCSNRHPKRLFKAMQNVFYETKIAARKYAAIIVMSKYMKDISLEAGFNKSSVVYNPLFTPNTKLDLEKEFVFACKRLLFVGRLSRTKGVHYFIQMGIILLEKNYDVILDIVGDGHDKNYFTSLIPERFKDKFIFHGWKSREEVDQIMKACYLLIFPSIYPEAFGISGVEAMMRGKPVVGFDVGGVSTWLKNEESGFLVPVKDLDTLTKKTIFLLDDTEAYNQMSKKARELALCEFSVDKHMNKLVDIYKNTLK